MTPKSIALSIAVNLVLTATSFGQANFGFRNYYPPAVDAPVFDAQGQRLAGATYLAELYGGATPNSLTPVVIFDSSLRREIVPFATDGYFSSNEAFLSVLAVPPNGWAWLQVRSWDARLGATYDEVLARGVGGYGESPLFYAQGGNPYVLIDPPPLIGLQSFSLRPVVPEPGAVGLLLLGGLLLFWGRRFRR
jgi:hypothetical protein